MPDVPQVHQWQSEQQIHNHIRYHSNDTNLHWCSRILASVESWRQDLYQHKRNQTETVGTQTQG